MGSPQAWGFDGIVIGAVSGDPGRITYPFGPSEMCWLRAPSALDVPDRNRRGDHRLTLSIGVGLWFRATAGPL